MHPLIVVIGKMKFSSRYKTIQLKDLISDLNDHGEVYKVMDKIMAMRGKNIVVIQSTISKGLLLHELENKADFIVYQS